jgi:hypothetical protein
MSNRTAAYEALVNEEAKSLQLVSGHEVTHGSEGVCPRCGHQGIYDVKGSGISGASIYFSASEEKWRCMACEMEPLGY